MAANQTSNQESKLRTLIIKPGERFILPQEARIQSLVYDGAIDVTSSCDNLPPPTTYRCGYFYLLLDKDDNPGHSMDEKFTYIESLKVGNNLYVINRRPIYDGDANNSKFTTLAQYNMHVPDQALFSFTRVQINQLNSRQAIYLYFKTVDSLFNTIEMAVNNRGSLSYFKGYVSECDMFEFGMDESNKDDILGPVA